MKNKTKPTYEFVMNSTMADAMAYESKKNEAEYYKEKEKNERLEALLDNSSKQIEVLNAVYKKTNEKYEDAVSKSAQILRSKQK